MSHRFLLDTNVFSEVNKKVPNAFVMERMNEYQNEVATASVVIHDLLYGCLRLPSDSNKRRFLFDYINLIPFKIPVFDYDLRAARWHAEERARLSKVGKMPAFADGQIVNIAFCNNLILVTNNVADFQFFDGFMIDNWFVDARDV